MGIYLSAGTLNQAALAQGQARRAAACWVICALGFIVWNLLPVLDEFRRVEVGFAGAAALLCGLLYLLYRRPRVHPRGRRARPGSPQELGGPVGGRGRSELSYSAPAASRSARRPRRDRGRRTPRSRRRTGSLPTPPRPRPCSASTPPSTSIARPGTSRPQPRDLVRRGGDERLAPPARVHRHAPHDVRGVAQLLDGSAGVPGFSATPARHPASRITPSVR